MIDKNLHIFNDEHEEEVEGVESEGDCSGGDIECENGLCPTNTSVLITISQNPICCS